MIVMADVSLSLLVLKTPRLDSLRAFYSALGIEWTEERPGEGPIHFSGRFGEVVFEIYPLTDAETVPESVRLGFVVANLAATVETFRAMGTSIVSEPKDTKWGQRAVVRDPDGRGVELFGGDAK
jgi:lactoylglutathione lyase